MTGVEFRPYRDGDEYAINAGFNAVFGQSRSLAAWHWKFPSSSGQRPIMLAVDPDGTVLVHYGATEVGVRVDGREYRAGQIVDVYSRIEARRGLAAARTYIANYNRFVERFCGPDRLAWCYGFPGDRALRLGVMRTLYDEIPPAPLRVFRRDVDRRPRRWRRGRVRVGFEPRAVDGVWEDSRDRYAAAVVRDSNRFGHRYLGRPQFEYVHLSVWSQGRPTTVAVASVTDHEVRLVDLIWNGKDGDDLAELDRELARLAERAGVARLAMWLEGDAAAEAVFARLGWRSEPHPERLHCVVRVFHPSLAQTPIAGRFYLTMGDSDLA